MAWNRPSVDGRTRSASQRTGAARPAVAMIVGAICAAFAVWWLWPSGECGEDTTSKKTSARIREVQPSLPSKTDKAVKVEPQSVKKPVIDPTVAKTNGIVSALNPEGRRFLSVVSNSTGMIITTYRRADGSLVEVQDWRRPKVQLSAADQLLNMVTAHAEGGPPAPVNPNDRSMDAVFKKALEKPLVLNDGDSETIKELKGRLNRVRADMDALMQQTGASFSEIIAEHQRTTKENAAILNDAQSLINESLRKGDKDGAATIYQQFAERLDQMGVTGLTLDPELEEDEADEQPIIQGEL